VKTVRWFIDEYRHEDKEGQYYLRNILHIWYNGLRTGLVIGLLPLVLVWILR